VAAPLYFEDLTPGLTFRTGSQVLDAEAIKAFARQYDPQPFHTDAAAAKDSFFGELVASGWHTMAVSMRLIVDGEFRPAGGVIGGGVDEFRWPMPVRPGDTLTVVSEIVESRPSRSRPEIGLVRARHSTLNQRGETVQTFIANHVVQRRPK
jgi:acyl dehydratase